MRNNLYISLMFYQCFHPPHFQHIVEERYGKQQENNPNELNAGAGPG
jgi:hypothetical protein